MIAIVTNNHCDSRNILIPGAGKVVRLPAFSSVEIEFSSELQMQAFTVELSIKAPAAQISTKAVAFEPIPDATSGDEYENTGEVTDELPPKDIAAAVNQKPIRHSNKSKKRGTL